MRPRRPRRGAALLLGGALFIGAGCAGAPPATGRGAPGSAPAADVVIAGVPFIPPAEESCGPTALAMLLRFLGKDAPVDEILGETRTAGLSGTLITDLAAAARRRGVPARVENLSADRLREEFAAGRPVILLVDLGLWVASRPHYLLAYGYASGGITAHSGADAGRVFPLRELDAKWARMNRLSIVIAPGKPP